MKVLIFLAFITTACATAGTSLDSSLSAKIATLKVGVSTKDLIVKKFGTPVKVESEPEIETLTYQDLNGNKRLKMTFLKNSEILDTVLWFPFADDFESKLENIYKKYGKEKFREKIIPSINSHALAPRYLYLSDDLKMTIYNNSYADQVEAIVWSSHVNREPAMSVEIIR